MLKFDCLGQVLVPLCGLLLRTLYVEARVHCRRLHGGGFLRRPGGDGLYPRYEEKGLPLRPHHPHCSTEHLASRGALWDHGGPLHAWGEARSIYTASTLSLCSGQWSQEFNICSQILDDFKVCTEYHGADTEGSNPITSTGVNIRCIKWLHSSPKPFGLKLFFPFILLLLHLSVFAEVWWAANCTSIFIDLLKLCTTRKALTGL